LEDGLEEGRGGVGVDFAGFVVVVELEELGE
jgi:hypothetical protein